jgi:hypothetical protein
MTMFSEILGDTEAIDRAALHIKRVAYDAQVRWETATRLGADLATAVTAYLTWEDGPCGYHDPLAGRTYRKALAEAIDAYRQAESGGFWTPGTLTYDEAVEWEAEVKAGG